MVIDAIKDWLESECGVDGHRKVLIVTIGGRPVARLVNIILYDCYAFFNDVDGIRHSVDYADPAFFDILTKVFSTGRR